MLVPDRFLYGRLERAARSGTSSVAREWQDDALYIVNVRNV